MESFTLWYIYFFESILITFKYIAVNRNSFSKFAFIAPYKSLLSQAVVYINDNKYIEIGIQSENTNGEYHHSFNNSTGTEVNI